MESTVAEAQPIQNQCIVSTVLHHINVVDKEYNLISISNDNSDLKTILLIYFRKLMIKHRNELTTFIERQRNFSLH